MPSGIAYGAVLLVEFDSDTLWREVSMTIAADALRRGTKVLYHTFHRSADDVRAAFVKLGLEVKRLENEKVLMLNDAYTRMIGLESRSMKLGGFDSFVESAQRIKAGIPEHEKRYLHVDEDTSVLLRYNQEKALVDFWNTEMIPSWRAHEDVVLNSLVTGVASDSFYRLMESNVDGIIEFKTKDTGDSIEQRVRARLMRGSSYDTNWHRLRLLDNGEVTIAN
jgi:KaiC/GvpD/RAD55 family RecA-like ATPase